MTIFKNRRSETGSLGEKINSYRLSERLVVFLRPRTLSQRWVVGEVFTCRPISTSSLFSSSLFSFLKVVFSKTLTLMIGLHRATAHFGNIAKIQKSSYRNAHTQCNHNLFKVELHFDHDIKREPRVVTSLKLFSVTKGTTKITTSYEVNVIIPVSYCTCLHLKVILLRARNRFLELSVSTVLIIQ